MRYEREKKFDNLLNFTFMAFIMKKLNRIK